MLCTILQSSGEEGMGEATLKKLWSGWDTNYPPVSVPNFSGAEDCDRESWRKVMPFAQFPMVVTPLLNINCYVMVLRGRCLHTECFMQHAYFPHGTWELAAWLDLPHRDFLIDTISGRRFHTLLAVGMPLPGRKSS